MTGLEQTRALSKTARRSLRIPAREVFCTCSNRPRVLLNDLFAHRAVSRAGRRLDPLRICFATVTAVASHQEAYWRSTPAREDRQPNRPDALRERRTGKPPKKTLGVPGPSRRQARRSLSVNARQGRGGRVPQAAVVRLRPLRRQKTRILRGGRDLRARRSGAAAARFPGRGRVLPHGARPISRRARAARARPALSARLRAGNRTSSARLRRPPRSGSMPRPLRSTPAITRRARSPAAGALAKTRTAITRTTSWRSRWACGSAVDEALDHLRQAIDSESREPGPRPPGSRPGDRSAITELPAVLDTPPASNRRRPAPGGAERAAPLPRRLQASDTLQVTHHG